MDKALPSTPNMEKKGREWWHRPVILALGKPRQEDHKFKVSLGNSGGSEKRGEAKASLLAEKKVSSCY